MVNLSKNIILFFFISFSFILSKNINSINVVTTNDIHGMLAEQEATFMNPNFPPTIIGAAGFETYLQDLQEIENDFLLLDGGNFFQGHPLGIVDSGRTVIEWMNKNNYNALVPGQYDFLFGIDNLINLSKKADFSFLASNLFYKSQEKLIFKPYEVFEIKDVKIAVIGVVHPQLSEFVLGNNINDVTIVSGIKSLKRWIPEIKEKKVDVIILLTSAGVPYDREEKYNSFIEDIKLYSKEDKDNYRCENAIELGYFSNDIDVIVSGGVSKGYNSPWYDPYSHVTIFQNYGNLTGFGHFLLNVDMDRRLFSGFSYTSSNRISQTLFLDDFDYDESDYDWIDKRYNASIKMTYSPVKWDSEIIPDNYGIEYIDSVAFSNWNVPEYITEYKNTIATWNCEFFPTADDSTIFALSEIVDDLNIDIIAFQEIKKRGWFYKLMRYLPNYDFIISNQSSFMDQAIIYKKNKFVLSNRIEPFSENDYNFAGRPPLQADFINLENKEKFSIINLHMKCCDSGLKRRQKAANMLYRYIDEKLYARKLIVLGDWNDDLKDKEGEHCFDDFLADGNYFFATERITNDKEQASYPKEPYVSFLDHILASKNFVDKNNYKIETLRLDKFMGGFDIYEAYISDHYPVLLSFD